MARVNQILEGRKRGCGAKREETVYLRGDRREGDIIALLRQEQKIQSKERMLLLFCFLLFPSWTFS